MRLFTENLPPEINESPSWTLWKKGIRDGKPAKVPYQANGKRAKSNDASTWAKFDTVYMAYQDIGGFDGICWMMPVKLSDIIFIDIDHCIKDGKIDEWAQKVIDDFDSYTERSQSGNGLHILIKGKKPIKRCRKFGSPFEIYDCLRPCYLTGDVVDGHTMIKARQEALGRLFNEIFTDEIRQANEPRKKATPGRLSLSDEQVIQRATLAKNGTEFKLLWDGSTLGYNGDESAADMALMNMLAFWTGGDALQMERLFSASALGRRAKWRDRPDYRERTIQKAISDARELYKPGNDHPKELWETTPKEQEALYDAVVGGSTISEDELNAYSLPDGPKFECRLPKDHFLQRFIAYGTDISDAYPDYWLAGGLYVLAVVADKKLKVVLKQGTIYPNLYVSINGKSSLARKSTAVDKTEIIIFKTLPQMLSAMVPTEFSPEAFVEHLSNFQHAPWIRDEAAGVLSLMKKDYMRGFKDSLMQLFDSKPFHRKLRTSQRKGSQTDFNVDDPYLNLLWATTGASLGANTDQTDTLSGFLARFIFFFPQGMKPRFMPLEEGTAEISMFEDLIVAQLRSIAAKMSEIPECLALHISPEAAAYYNRWQETREREWIATDDGAAMQIFSRMNPLIVKLGIIFELGAADFDPTKPIRLEFIEEACRLVDEYLMPTSRAVYDLVGASADKNDIDKIVAFLKQHNGKGSRREIMRYVKIKRKDFDDYVSMMVESEMIDEKIVDNKGKGRNPVYLFLRDNAKVTNVSNVPKVTSVTSVPKIPVSENQGDFCDTGDVGDTSDSGDKGDAPHVDAPMVEPKPKKENPNFQKFKAGIAKHHCCLCGRNFSYDLTPYYANGERGYICSTCHMQGPPSPPIKVDTQTKF